MIVIERTLIPAPILARVIIDFRHLSFVNKVLRDLSEDISICKKLNYLSATSIGPVPKPVIEVSTQFASDITGGGTKTLDEEKEDRVYDGNPLALLLRV